MSAALVQRPISVLSTIYLRSVQIIDLIKNDYTLIDFIFYLLYNVFNDKTLLMSKKADKNQSSLSDIVDNNPSPAGVNSQHSSEILSMVAHELKNPLSSIRGYTELLMSNAVGELNPQQRQFLATIQANITRMSDLITDLSDMSLVDSNRLKLEMTSFSISTNIDELTKFLLPKFDEKNLQFNVDIDTDIPNVYADRKRTGQILVNLIGNAAKYTLPGGKIDVIVTKITKEGKSFIQTEIKDTGLGIKEEDKAWIFQRYFRAEDAQRQDIPGTGLGLFISKRLVELMNGSIWFESTYNQGSIFYFTLLAGQN
jgi:signal transduction histidine kinase